MRRLAPAIAVALVAAALALGGRSAATGQDVLGPGPVAVELQVHHSRFTPDHLRARPGTILTITVRNDDPIGHELIIGDAELHRRHEAGTEPSHAPRPGEVSVPALGTASTTYEVPAGPDVTFACHLPGHLRYGMHGVVEVVPAT